MSERQPFPLWLKFTIAIVAIISIMVAIGACERKKPTPEPADSVAVDTAAVVEDSVEDDLEELPPELEASDTIITPEDSAMRRNRPRMAAPPGKPTGLTKLPTDQWCSGKYTGTVAVFAPRLAAGALRRAEYCGIAILGAMPRGQLTNTGKSRGYFVLSKGKQACDALSRAFTDSDWNRFERNLSALMLIDEPHMWQRPSKPREVAEYIKYCAGKLPPVPLILRMPPNHKWLKEIPASSWSDVDLFWSQWHKKRGPKSIRNLADRQKAYYDSHLRDAQRYGAGVVMGVNVRDIEGANSNVYATPEEVRTHVGVATRHPDNCFSTHWWHEDRMDRMGSLMDAWRDVVALGRSTQPVSCK